MTTPNRSMSDGYVGPVTKEYTTMIDLLMQFFSNKQAFTYVILFLYFSNFAFQCLVTKDYVWGGYWFSAGMITVFAMAMSQR